MTEPRLAAISPAPSQTLFSGAFRSLHCLIYKVLAPPPQRRNTRYFTTGSLVCQALFSTFFKSFSGALNLAARSQTACSFYQNSGPLSSPFFQFLELFSSRRPRALPRPRQLAYYTKSFLLCQLLFSKKSKFFLIRLYSLSYPISQAPFAWFSAGNRIYTGSFLYILYLKNIIS